LERLQGGAELAHGAPDVETQHPIDADTDREARPSGDVDRARGPNHTHPEAWAKARVDADVALVESSEVGEVTPPLRSAVQEDASAPGAARRGHDPVAAEIERVLMEALEVALHVGELEAAVRHPIVELGHELGFRHRWERAQVHVREVESSVVVPVERGMDHGMTYELRQPSLLQVRERGYVQPVRPNQSGAARHERLTEVRQSPDGVDPAHPARP
jgi:hypothetical protein